MSRACPNPVHGRALQTGGGPVKCPDCGAFLAAVEGVVTVTDDDLGARDERKWTDGYNAALRSVLGDLLSKLRGSDEGDAVAAAERWRLERMDVVALLRRVCADHGDNDWPDNLHLSDVIEKHLLRHLEIDA